MRGRCGATCWASALSKGLSHCHVFIITILSLSFILVSFYLPIVKIVSGLLNTLKVIDLGVLVSV